MFLYLLIFMTDFFGFPLLWQKGAEILFEIFPLINTNFKARELTDERHEKYFEVMSVKSYIFE